MKKALIILGVACSVFFGMAALLSFSGEDAALQPRESRAELAVEPMATPSIYTKDFTIDTIANAANDTLALGANIVSNYEWSYHIIRTNISGTTNIAVTVQASGNTTGDTDWVTVATTSATTATNEILSGVSFYGLRHRVIVDGTGTQSSSYKIKAVLKKKY